MTKKENKNKITNFFKPYFKSEYRDYQIGGKEIKEPYPIKGVIFLIVFILTIISWLFVEGSIGILFTNSKAFFNFLGNVFNPNFSYFEKTLKPLVETIQLSVAGTIIGSVIAIPFAILSASNITKNKWVYGITRFIMSLIRTIPTLVFALILIYIVGVGTLPGMLALSIFTFAIVAKMLYEKIEMISLDPVEALESSGANKFQSFMTAVVPQVKASYLSIVLYTFEINVRTAAILGYVGAGGIGYLLSERMDTRNYGDVGMVLLVFFVTIFIVENLSRMIRKKLN